ncbi:MAG: SoxR reducing system RseC family protein [Clostridiales bacterium]|nr:SoxR reducing system RseC family protein [Clostridiales bacterium]
MTQQAIVKSVAGNTAKVVVLRADACGHCAEKSFCLGCAKTITAVVKNDIGAHPGDKVTLESSSKHILLYSFLAFLLPIIAGIAAYIITSAVWDKSAAAFVTVGVFLAVFALTLIITRLFSSKDLEIHIVQIDRMGPYDKDGSLSESAVRRI